MENLRKRITIVEGDITQQKVDGFVEVVMCSINGTNFKGAIFDNAVFVDCWSRETIWPNGEVVTDWEAFPEE